MNRDEVFDALIEGCRRVGGTPIQGSSKDATTIKEDKEIKSKEKENWINENGLEQKS